MSRSPWRDALDGQAQIIRELRRPVSVINLGRTANIPAVQERFGKERDYARFLAEAGATLAEGIENLIREAEPVYLTHDIQEYINRRIDLIAAGRMKLPNIPLTKAMLPIPSGLIWFTHAGIVLKDVELPSGNDHQHQGTVYIKAIYFGEDIELQFHERPGRNIIQGRIDIEARSSGLTSDQQGMGITAFLDARRSGFNRMVQEFGDHLVPVPLSGWRFGATLTEELERYDQTQGQPDWIAQGVDVSGTRVLLVNLCVYLQQLFLLMLQRITRWGGVGLNRTETREAEREKLRPRVQLVTWRKADYKYPEGHIPAPKNWSCRWSVREHYRRYRSGKVVKIESYIKGPHDRPFRGPTQRAHQVKQ